MPLSKSAVSPSGEISYCSSLEDDVWHGLGGPNAFETWHFDAVSDDGREALVISFYDNYPLSPRFHTAGAGWMNAKGNGVSSSQRFPAVSLVYSKAGTPVFQAVNEYPTSEFNVNKYALDYSIGDSSFSIENAEYGKGVLVKVDIRSQRGRRIKGEFEWLFVESDLMKQLNGRLAANWNIVSPRADVSGKIVQVGRFGKARKTVHFRGTGYHDQITSENIHYKNLDSRLWGRAHFIDSTVVFDQHGGVSDPNAAGQIFLIRNGEFEHCYAECTAIGHKRTRLGLLIPEIVRFSTANGVSIEILPKIPVRMGVIEVKMLCEVLLGMQDGPERRTVGLVEFVDPRRMKSWFYRSLADLQIGRSGRSPII